MTNQHDLVFDPELIRRFDINGPRYTSYPTADRFVEAFDARTLSTWLSKRAADVLGKSLSLYFHIPFCNTICYYCACNKIITKDHSLSAKYLDYLDREMALQAALLGEARQVS
ncbi:MAG: coproporphyrinogen III oxidase, partial [Betaproteobacteria bacterium]|nr:coproporphyrinogen III oxidase [Betaproteobacteria bacterium]